MSLAEEQRQKDVSSSLLLLLNVMGGREKEEVEGEEEEENNQPLSSKVNSPWGLYQMMNLPPSSFPVCCSFEVLKPVVGGKEKVVPRSKYGGER